MTETEWRKLYPHTPPVSPDQATAGFIDRQMNLVLGVLRPELQDAARETMERMIHAVVLYKEPTFADYADTYAPISKEDLIASIRRRRNEMMEQWNENIKKNIEEAASQSAPVVTEMVPALSIGIPPRAPAPEDIGDLVRATMKKLDDARRAEVREEFLAYMKAKYPEAEPTPDAVVTGPVVQGSADVAQGKP